MKRTMKIVNDVPAGLRGSDFRDVQMKQGTLVTVVREFWFNGEGWVRLSDGRELPDIFVGDVDEEITPCSVCGRQCSRTANGVYVHTSCEEATRG